VLNTKPNDRSSDKHTSFEKDNRMNSYQLEARIENMERRLNRYRGAAGLLGVAVVGLLAVAATPGKEVVDELRAHRVVVINEQGTPVAIMAAEKFGGKLVIKGQQGPDVIGLIATEKGGSFFLADQQGLPHLDMMSEDAGGRMDIRDKAGHRHSFTAMGPAKMEK